MLLPSGDGQERLLAWDVTVKKRDTHKEVWQDTREGAGDSPKYHCAKVWEIVKSLSCSKVCPVQARAVADTKQYMIAQSCCL